MARFSYDFTKEKKATKEKSIESVDNYIFSDWHIGATTLSDSGLIGRNPIHKQIDRLCASIETQHIVSERADVYILGDIIEGHLHKSGQSDLEIQFAEAQVALSRVLNCILERYRVVNIFGIPGNHGKLETNDINTRHKNAEILLYQSLPFKIKTGVKVVHNRIFAFHGDFGVGKAYPDSSRFRELLSHQLRMRNAKIAIMGHFHRPELFMDMSRTIIINGTLKKPGNYEHHCGYDDYDTCQVMFTTKGSRVLNFRLLYT